MGRKVRLIYFLLCCKTHIMSINDSNKQKKITCSDQKKIYITNSLHRMVVPRMKDFLAIRNVPGEEKLSEKLHSLLPATECCTCAMHINPTYIHQLN